jgi:GST-like protein
MNRRLAEREYLAGNYSIADMAAYPWVVPHDAQGQNLAEFPHLKRWFETIKARPATIRAYELAPTFSNSLMTEEAQKILFGQTAASTARL